MLGKSPAPSHILSLARYSDNLIVMVFFEWEVSLFSPSCQLYQTVHQYFLYEPLDLQTGSKNQMGKEVFVKAWLFLVRDRS